MLSLEIPRDLFAETTLQGATRSYGLVCIVRQARHPGDKNGFCYMTHMGYMTHLSQGTPWYLTMGPVFDA